MSKKNSSIRFDKEEDPGIRNLNNFLQENKNSSPNFIPGLGQIRGEMTTDAFMKLLGNEQGCENQNPFSKLPKHMLPEFSIAQSNCSFKAPKPQPMN